MSITNDLGNLTTSFMGGKTSVNGNGAYKNAAWTLEDDLVKKGDLTGAGLVQNSIWDDGNNPNNLSDDVTKLVQHTQDTVTTNGDNQGSITNGTIQQMFKQVQSDAAGGNANAWSEAEALKSSLNDTNDSNGWVRHTLNWIEGNIQDGSATKNSDSLNANVNYGRAAIVHNSGQDDQTQSMENMYIGLGNIYNEHNSNPLATGFDAANIKNLAQTMSRETTDTAKQQQWTSVFNAVDTYVHAAPSDQEKTLGDITTQLAAATGQDNTVSWNK